jgi:uncharacterized membrane protein
MKKIIYIAILTILVVFSSCTSVSEEDLINSTPPPILVTYEADVQSTLSNNCIFCHNNPPVNGASTSLLTYDNVVISVENNNLISRISSQPGQSGAMPLGGPRLPQNLIDLIIQWEADGFIEN